MTRDEQIEAVKEMIVNNIVGKSAMENWGIKFLEGEGFLESHNIAKNRFYRLATTIVDSIELDEINISNILEDFFREDITVFDNGEEAVKDISKSLVESKDIIKINQAQGGGV